MDKISSAIPGNVHISNSQRKGQGTMPACLLASFKHNMDTLKLCYIWNIYKHQDNRAVFSLCHYVCGRVCAELCMCVGVHTYVKLV